MWVLRKEIEGPPSALILPPHPNHEHVPMDAMAPISAGDIGGVHLR
jgi:hypothetical protein